MLFDKSTEIINAANEVLQQAYENLISKGFFPKEAEERVKRNFHRVNKDPNLILTVEGLLK